MAIVIDGTKVAPHGLFYMENAGGYNFQPAHPETAPSMAADEHQPSCFALEEDKGRGLEGQRRNGIGHQ
jgi:hypothetical protein